MPIKIIVDSSAKLISGKETIMVPVDDSKGTYNIGNVEVIDPPASKAQIGSEAVGEADTIAASESET